MITGIYRIKNVVNGKQYIGSTVNIDKRWKEHKKVLENKVHHSEHLQNAWYKYGESNFVFEIIEECIPEMLLEREQYWLDFYKSWDSTNGYNVCKFAGNTLGFRHSEESRLLMGKMRKGKYCGEKNHMKKLEYRQLFSELSGGCNNPMYGQKLSSETKEKISLALRGENNPMFNKHHTEKTREKIKEKLKETVLKGDKHPCAKLTWEKVCEIRKKYFSGIYSQKKLAVEYEVLVSAIWKIIHNKTWKEENL